MENFFVPSKKLIRISVGTFYWLRFLNPLNYIYGLMGGDCVERRDSWWKASFGPSFEEMQECISRRFYGFIANEISGLNYAKSKSLKLFEANLEEVSELKGVLLCYFFGTAAEESPAKNEQEFIKGFMAEFSDWLKKNGGKIALKKIKPPAILQFNESGEIWIYILESHNS